MLDADLLRALLDNLPDNVYYKDRESRFIRINHAAAKWFGIDDPRDAEGKTDFDLFTKEHAQAAYEDEQRIIQSGLPMLHKQEKETWPDGRVTWVDSCKMPLRDHRGQIIGTFGISRDVTRHKLAEEALERERDLLRTLINHLPDLIFVKDAEGRFVAANDALLDALGGKRLSEVVGKTDFDFFDHDLAAHFHADDEQVVRSGRPLIDREETIIDRQGHRKWLLTTKVPLLDADGKVTGLVGIGRNVTRLKQIESDLMAAKETADAASRAKSDFVANMSHEIRTPMNAIIGMTELLLDTQLTANQREYLRMVESSGEALLGLLNDILDFSKIEAGKLELEATPFDLRDSLGDTIRSLSLRAHGKGLELAFRVATDVPDLLRGDVGRLRQIIVNLVGNAIKFTERGEVLVDVACERRDDAETVLRFSVSDTGIGIPRDKQQRIFAEFEQADSSTTRRYGGTGLGLAISSRLVSLMGGRIEVQSQVNRGSTFRFTARFGALDQPASDGTAGVSAISDTPVLVVDDNATNRRILVDMLTNWGMCPKAVDGARPALEALRSAAARGKPFRVLLSDVNMPEADGYALVRWIRDEASFAELPIVLLTSGGRSEDRQLREELHVAAQLLKPVKQSELFSTVVMLLEGHLPRLSAEPADVVERTSAATPLRILLAEDNRVNQMLATAVLQRQGHQATVVDNGREAVRTWTEGDFDAVLMDVEMPEMDGFEATREIRALEAARGGHVAIIAMTAHAMQGDRERCLEAGMDEYLAKPIRAEQVREKLAQITRRTSRSPESADQPPSSPRDEPAAEAARTDDADAGHAADVHAADVHAGPGHAGPGDDAVDWNEALKNVNGDRNLLKQLIQVFCAQAPEGLAALRQAIKEGHQANIRLQAHTLKGSTLFLGTTPLWHQTFRLEQIASGREAGDLAEVLAGVEAAAAALLDELERFAQQDAAVKISGGPPDARRDP